MQPQFQNYNELEIRKVDRQKTLKKIKILISLGLLLLLLLGILLYAALNKGGINNLKNGDSNSISNTIKNVGTTFKDVTPTPTLKPRIELPSPNENLSSNLFIDAGPNYLSLSISETYYSATVKKGNSIRFANMTGSTVSLKFSDGRKFAIRDSESEAIIFLTIGSFSFSDELDSSQNKISGKISVID